MNNCKDCKHWGTDKTCGRIDMAEEWDPGAVYCKLDDAVLYVHASDDQGLRAGVRTGPMFGCTKFVQK